MNKSDLVNKLESSDYLLPKEIIAEVNEAELVTLLIEIFSDEKQKLVTEEKFQHNYFEVINYIVINNLNTPKPERKKLFDASFLDELLAIPVIA